MWFAKRALVVKAAGDFDARAVGHEVHADIGGMRARVHAILLKRAEDYGGTHGITLGPHLGAGAQGVVFSTDRESAIKVHAAQPRMFANATPTCDWQSSRWTKFTA